MARIYIDQTDDQPQILDATTSFGSADDRATVEIDTAEGPYVVLYLGAEETARFAAPRE